MKKFTAKNGYLAYNVDFEEVSKLGGLAFCDDCNQYATEGFLVPVLNYYMCPQCFARWESTASCNFDKYRLNCDFGDIP